jgi:hypothetical protein
MLHIAHQTSEKKMIWVCGVTQALFCIVSPYTLKCVYSWKNALGPVGVNSPVLYVKLPGVYQCTVRSGAYEVTSNEMIVVEDADGEDTPSSDRCGG